MQFVVTAPPSEARFCTQCGVVKAKPACHVCGADANGVPLDIEALARRLNWGAFLLPGLWPFWHGRPWIGAAWWACLGAAALGWYRFGLVAPGAIAAFGIAAYVLVYGNRIALCGRRFRDAREFFAVEGAWMRWGAGVLLGGAALAAAVLADALLAPV